MPCGKRLKPFMPKIIDSLISHGELEISEDIKALLIQMSSSTIDRLLRPYKMRLKPKGRATTKPGKILIERIPIKTFYEWRDTEPGFFEIDMVAHCGATTRGEYFYTLNCVDVATSWVEIEVVRNRSRSRTVEALDRINRRVPFPVKGIHSDNGSEFINSHFLYYCEVERINFTRSRPDKKDDNSYVEQKNWTVVRRNVGYMRYDTEAEYRVMKELYGHLRLYVNFFQPTMKLVMKERVGRKYRKVYDEAKTPFERLKLSGVLTYEVERELEQLYLSTNPVELKRKIEKLKQKLYNLSRRKLQ